MSGLLLFARYAFAPNLLGYCGPNDHAGFQGYLEEAREDEGLGRLAVQFEGALPYLRIIAGANGIGDPFDRRVVEAYWIGNDLLERVEASRFYESLKDRFLPRMSGREFSWMTAGLASGAKPHHNFHVLDVYRRAGLMRDDRAAVAVERMDQCRISWGRVKVVEGSALIVDRAPLVFAEGRLGLGPVVPSSVLRRDAGIGEDYKPGDDVSMHWGWVCDRLGKRAVTALSAATERAIAHTNLTL
ncbi:MAG TPA: DUF6390 family protein [Spirochaetia bacterium]|nr:DUF6390 family protein [Spirochaetia bacterium]